MVGTFAIWLTLTLIQQARVEPEDITAKLDGKRIVVEGLYNGQVGTGISRQLGMTNSTAKLILGRRFDQKLSGVQNIEIVGTVRAQGPDVFVDVATLRVLPSDLEAYEARAGEIRNGDFQAWYELAQWASQRDKKYPGHGLKEKVEETYQRGIEVERRAAMGNPTALRRLVQRADKELKLKDFDYADVEHEILRAEFATLDATSAERIEEFARRVRDRLPFRDRAEMTAASEEFRKNYDADPINVFQKSSDDERKQLARYWQVTLLARAQELKQSQGRSDWLTLSEVADAEMPDYPEIAERWLEQAKEEAIPKLPLLSRGEIQRLSDSLSRSREEAGREIRERWLEAKEKSFRELEKQAAEKAKKRRQPALPPNARERMDLAKDYLAWFKEDPDKVRKAVELLSEALTIDPNFVAAQSLLEQAGYVRGPDGTWVSKESTPLPATTVPQSSTPLGVGMTPERVLEIKGPPDSRSRQVTANRVIHQWIYHAIDETTHVFFDQAKDGSLRVTSLRQAR